jgi:hypothetical protein
MNLSYTPDDVMSSHYGHRFKIVPTYPSIYKKEIPMITGSSKVSESLIVPYDQDEYKIILERIFRYGSQMVGVLEDTVTLADVVNSTFTVIRNYPTIEATPLFENYNCSEQRVRVSLTTMNNIPLKGEYVVDIVKEREESGPVHASRVMKQKTNITPTTMLNTTLRFVPGYLQGYCVRIMIDHKLWALSEKFFVGC